MKKRLAFAFLTVLLLLGLSTAASAAVLGDDYKYSGVAAGVYYVDDWNFYRGECTSFVAWRLNSANGVPFHNTWNCTGGTKWGNAKDWGSQANRQGIPVNSTPAVGAVAWSNSGSYGHVAWVAEVNGNNVVIEEYNNGSVQINGEWYGNHKYNCRTVSSSSFQYIHIKDLPTTPVFTQVYPSNGTYVLETAVSGSRCLGLGDGLADGLGDIVSRAKTDQNDQAFQVTRSGDYYKITHMDTGLCLDVSGASGDNGANVQLWTDNGGPAQKWKFYDAGGGSYYLSPECSGNYLDVAGASTDDGAQVRLWTANESVAQKWRLVAYQPKRTVTFDANGGEGAPAPIVSVSGGKVTVPDQTPTREGYTFQGWEEAGVTYGPGDVYTCPDKDVTLWARWTENVYTVTFHPGAGTGGPETMTVPVGRERPIPLDRPERPGYLFLGWSVASSAVDYRPGDALAPEDDMDLYAVWGVVSLTGCAPAVSDDGVDMTASLTYRSAGQRERFTVVFGLYGPTGAIQGVRAQTVTAESGGAIPLSLGKIAFGPEKGVYTAKCFLLQDGLRPVSPAVSQTILDRLPVGDVSDWVPAHQAPAGAEVVEEKWVYTLTEKTQSTQDSMDGWERTGECWVETGSEGTHDYAAYPSGFDPGHQLYGRYQKSAYVAGTSEENGVTRKTEVLSTAQLGYIYYHWTYNQSALPNGNYNVYIEDAYRWVDGREYYNFRAFESAEEYGHTDPNGRNGGDCFCAWFDDPQDGSWWWYRFPVYRQTWAEYTKHYQFQRVLGDVESRTEVVAGDTVSNVRHLVKYRF